MILGSMARGARKGELRTRLGLTLGTAVEARETVREAADMIIRVNEDSGVSQRVGRVIRDTSNGCVGRDLSWLFDDGGKT